MTNTDLKPASQIYDAYGIPRAALRELAARGLVQCVERKIDVCHTINLYSTTDVVNYIEHGAADEQS